MGDGIYENQKKGGEEIKDDIFSTTRKS